MSTLLCLMPMEYGAMTSIEEGKKSENKNERSQKKKMIKSVTEADSHFHIFTQVDYS